MSESFIPLGEVLRSRDEVPALEAVLSGDVPIVAKVRFADGGVELRASSNSRTALILVRRGDLLVSGINALKGAVALHPKEAPSDVAATIHYGAYELNEERVLPRYIHEYLRSPAFRRRAVSQLPNGIKTELKAKRLLTVEVPLPSKLEQARRLHELDARSRVINEMMARRHAESAMVLGRRVTIGVDARRLLAARLRDMQEDVVVRSPLAALESVLVEGLRHGPSFPCSMDGEGTPVLMPSSTTGFGLDTTKVLYGVGDVQLRELDYLEPGDIIFARGNKPDQVGNCGLYEGDLGVMTYANLFMRVRVDSTSVEPWFAQYWLMTPMVREHVRRHTKGTGPSIQKINGQGVRSIPFPRGVPREVQKWWIGSLDRMRLLTSRLEELMARQAEDFAALQRRAVEEVFRGL